MCTCIVAKIVGMREKVSAERASVTGYLAECGWLSSGGSFALKNVGKHFASNHLVFEEMFVEDVVSELLATACRK